MCVMPSQLYGQAPLLQEVCLVQGNVVMFDLARVHNIGLV